MLRPPSQSWLPTFGQSDMRATNTQQRVPFFSSMVSYDWRQLGYPSFETAAFWDTRSCGVACLRMVYAQLVPGLQISPAVITEELLRDSSYTEQSGWNHYGLARHAKSNGLEADLVQLSAQEDFIQAALGPGVLIVSISHSFESGGHSGHLAVIAGITSSGDVRVHRPSSQHPTDGCDVRIDLQTFWAHFSGRAIHIRRAQLP